jgi:ABC-type uncharacterized transport system YnjBCD substrate-binding protein
VNVYTKASPWQSNQERLVGEALAVATIPGDMLANIPPPLPQIQKFPPRFGYGVPADRVPGIEDVMGTLRTMSDNRTSLSGTNQEINSSARNVGNQPGW